MIIDITFKTEQFNLSVVGPDFINDCCFGEELSQWLVGALAQQQIQAGVIGMEDFGWANSAQYDGIDYLICIAGSSDENPAQPDMGEWHIMLERKRSLFQRLLGKNNTTENEALSSIIIDILKAAGFTNITFEFA